MLLNFNKCFRVKPICLLYQMYPSLDFPKAEPEIKTWGRGSLFGR